MTSLTMASVLGIMATHAQILPQRQSLYRSKVNEIAAEAARLDALKDVVMWWGPSIVFALKKEKTWVNNAFKFGIERRSGEVYRMEVSRLLGERFRVARFSPSPLTGLFVGDFLEVSWDNPE